MAFILKTYDCFVKRPFLIIYIAAVSLIYSVIQLFNPIIGLLQNLGAIRSESWTDSMISADFASHSRSGMCIVCSYIRYNYFRIYECIS